MGSSSSITKRRIQNQLKDIQENPPSNWKVEKQNQYQWNIWITTQMNTPFHSVPFKLIVAFPQNYPKEKPQFKIEQYSKFYHPNISPTNGGICLTTFQQHEPTDTIRNKIDTFIQFLGIPNTAHGLNHEALKHYQNNPNQYYKKAIRQFRGFK